MKRDRVATGEAARRLGVAPATIQRWVDLGLLHAERTLGGHRRISIAELHRLMASTRPAEMAKPLAEWLDVLLAADPLRLRTRMLTARQRTANWAQVADELASVIVELGRQWEVGRCLVFEEHLASEALRRAAALCATDLAQDSHSPRAVLFTIAGERHTLGLSLAELVLAEAGWRVHLVGEGPPAEEILPLLRQLKPKLLVVSGSAGMTRRATTAYENCLREALSTRRAKLILAGSAPWAPVPNAHIVESFEELLSVIQHIR